MGIIRDEAENITGYLECGNFTDVDIENIAKHFKDIIDKVESAVNDIEGTLEKVDINSLDRVEEAYSMAKNLSEALY